MQATGFMTTSLHTGAMRRERDCQVCLSDRRVRGAYPADSVTVRPVRADS